MAPHWGLFVIPDMTVQTLADPEFKLRVPPDSVMAIPALALGRMPRDVVNEIVRRWAVLILLN